MLWLIYQWISHQKVRSDFSAIHGCTGAYMGAEVAYLCSSMISNSPNWTVQIIVKWLKHIPRRVVPADVVFDQVWQDTYDAKVGPDIPLGQDAFTHWLPFHRLYTFLLCSCYVAAAKLQNPTCGSWFSDLQSQIAKNGFAPLTRSPRPVGLAP